MNFAKYYLKIGEVSTLHFREDTFEQLDQFRTSRWNPQIPRLIAIVEEKDKTIAKLLDKL